MEKGAVVVSCSSSHRDRNSSNVCFQHAACKRAVEVRTPSMSSSTASKAPRVTRGGTTYHYQLLTPVSFASLTMSSADNSPGTYLGSLVAGKIDSNEMPATIKNDACKARRRAS